MGGVRGEVTQFFLVGHAAVLAFLAACFLPRAPAVFLWNAAASTVAGLLFWAVTRIALRVIRERDNRALSGLGLANRLTLSRFLMIVPIVGLIAADRFVLWIGAYALCLLTDVADGVIARRRSEQSEFGVIMDPVTDVLSTAAVFAAFLSKDWIPGWVFAVLALRYGSLFAGGLILSMGREPLRFRATAAGKIVGVLQGLTAILIGVLAWGGGGGLQRYGAFIYAFLGVIFASVIVSQGVIGIRHLRKGTANA